MALNRLDYREEVRMAHQPHVWVETRNCRIKVPCQCCAPRWGSPQSSEEGLNRVPNPISTL